MFKLALLIRKDFILVRNFMPVFLLSFLFVTYVQMDSFSMFAAFQSLLLLVYSCSIDVMNNNRRFVLGLPVSRQEIVLAKYLSLIPCSFIGMVCSLVLCLISYLSGSSIDSDNWIALALTLLMIPLAASIYLPVHYWLGNKNNNLNVFVNVIVTIISISVGPSLLNTSFFITITQIKLADHLVQLGLIGIVYLFILYLSYKISLQLFSREEL